MNCKICNSQTKEVFQHVVLNKYMVKYYHCDHCGFLQTENPYWLEESYQRPINLSDTGYVSRNVYLARRALFLFTILFGRKGTYLDYAGGYGLLTRLMRDYGLNFLWLDPYTQNIFASGFEYNDQKIMALTCFECFEHFEKPIEEIEKILAISDNIFFSTQILPLGGVIPTDDWHYYGFDHGQHLSFYSIKTMEYLAKKYNLHYYTDGSNLHLFTKKTAPGFWVKTVLALSRLPLEFLLKRTNGSLLTKDHDQIVNSSLN